MASVRTLKNGTHQVRHQGKSVGTFPVGKKGLKEAERWCVEVNILHARGEPIPDRNRTVQVLLLKDLFEKYKNHQKDVVEVKPRTGQKIVIAINLFLHFLREKVRPRGDLDVELLTQEKIEAFYSWMRNEREWKKKKGVSAFVARERAMRIWQAWKWIFARHQNATPVPVDLDLPRARTILRPRRHTWEECDRVIAQATIPWLQKLMITARFTSLRKEQCMALLGTDFRIDDPDNATMTIRPELGKTAAEQQGRTVPIAPPFARLLKTWDLDDGYLIKTPGEKRTITYRSLRAYWQAATGERPRQPLHGFRKAFEQEMRRRKVSDDVRDLLVGHAQGSRRGSGTDATYIGEDPLMPEARAAVRLIPAIGQAGKAHEPIQTPRPAKRRVRIVRRRS